MPECNAEECENEAMAEWYVIDGASEYGWLPLCQSHGDETPQPSRPIQEETDGR